MCASRVRASHRRSPRLLSRAVSRRNLGGVSQDGLSNAERRAERIAREEHRYRVAAFRRLGFDEIDALELAKSDVSISFVRERLLERGATHKQALRCAL